MPRKKIEVRDDDTLIIRAKVTRVSRAVSAVIWSTARLNSSTSHVSAGPSVVCTALASDSHIANAVSTMETLLPLASLTCRVFERDDADAMLDRAYRWMHAAIASVIAALISFVAGSLWLFIGYYTANSA